MNKRNRKIIQLQANAARKALKYVKHTKFIDQYWRYTVDWGDSKRIDQQQCLHFTAREERLLLLTDLINQGLWYFEE